jgi:hypothetical protein
MTRRKYHYQNSDCRSLAFYAVVWPSCSTDSSGNRLGYGLEDRGIRVLFPAGTVFLFYGSCSLHPMGTGIPSSWVKMPVCEPCNSLPSAEVKNAWRRWSYTSTSNPQYVCMAPCVIKHRNLTFTGAGIATGYGLDDRGVGVRVQVGARIFCSPRPDRLWSPPSLLFNGYWGPFTRG